MQAPTAWVCRELGKSNCSTVLLEGGGSSRYLGPQGQLKLVPHALIKREQIIVP